MGFGDNLKETRKQRNMTQEELAELLNVSRQAISKWESGTGYPETEKLILISRELNISLDYLLNDTANLAEKETAEKRNAAYAPSGKIAITTFDRENVVVCHAVKSSRILAPGKREPKYVLNGIDKVTFWGEHSTILGWYKTLEDIQKEISEITEALNQGIGSYTLKYAADIEYVGFFAQPKVKE